MAYQQILRKSYIAQLRNEVAESVGLERYSAPFFPIDESKILVTSQIQAPESLRDKLNPENDLEAAITLFEAYPNLKPIQAYDNAFWVTLCHSEDLFPYVQKRWPINPKKPIAPQIIQHWFSRQLMRNALANLWWSVYLSIDEEAEDKYELTRILFMNQTFRVRVFGTSMLFRHKEAVMGILRFMKDNLRWFKSLESQGRFIAMHFNKLGAIKQLAALKRDFFYNEMNNIVHEIIRLNILAPAEVEEETEIDDTLD